MTRHFAPKNRVLKNSLVFFFAGCQVFFAKAEHFGQIGGLFSPKKGGAYRKEIFRYNPKIH